MTAISLLGGDFELLLDDENNQNGGTLAVAGMRAIVRPTSPATTNIYTTRTLYSAIADVTDDVIAMGFRNPMLPVTPNAYTMENKYFIQRRACEFLSEGAIDVDVTVASGDGVYRKTYAAAPAAAPVFADIGKQIVETTSGDTGTVIDFETEPDGTLVIWIRPDAAADTFLSTSGTLLCTADGGTFSGTCDAVSSSGVSKYAAVQAIGSVPTATEVYLYQNRVKMTDFALGFQWWATDPTLSLGIISILIRTQNADTLIAAGDVEVFARRYTSLYDNFRLNVSAGGFSALPLASAPDINNTTGYFDGVWQSGTGTAMLVGDVLSNTTGGKEDGKYVVTAVSDSGATGTFSWYETGDLTPFATTDTFTSANRNGTINGAPTAGVDGPTETGAGNGATVTIDYGHYDVDHDGDATTEPYSIQIDAQSLVPIATVYEVLKYRTRRGASAADLFTTPTNQLGEQYRGIERFFEYDASTTTLGAGEDLFTTTGGNTWTGVLVGQSGSTTPTYITVADEQTSTDAVIDNDVIEDEAGTDDVTVHAGGTEGIRSVTSPKSSPFGTFTGTQIFGAPGVVFINPAPADTQAYTLTDDFAVLNQSPNTIAFAVANTISGDRIIAAQQSATAGVMEKDISGIWGMVVGAASYNRLADQEIRCDGPVAVAEDVPAAGTLRVIDTAQKEEHLYFYSARTLGTPGIFTLTDEADFTGTADATTSDTVLEDAAATWTTGVVPEIGMMVRNTTNGGDVYEIISVAATTLGLKKLYGSGDAFAVGDGFEINKVIGGDHTATPADYGIDDGIYITYLDVEASGTSVSNSFIKSLGNDFTMVVNVRNGKTILPFTLNQLQEDATITVTTVRTPDAIAV
tara:strand:- start:750 stop:3326 length:2577 start_codon:yes stop_codon:yes gene_type:complete